MVGEYLMDNPDSSKEQAMFATKSTIQTEFLEKLKEELLRMLDYDGEEIEHHILSLDKDIPPR